jgi:hypothetical protein
MVDYCNFVNFLQKWIGELSCSGGAAGDAGKVDIVAALAAIRAPSQQDLPVSMFNGAWVLKKVIALDRNHEFVNLCVFVPFTEPSSALASVSRKVWSVSL